MEGDAEAALAALFEKAEQYGKTSAELLKLKAIDKTADVASTLISGTMILFIGLFLLMVSIGIALWIDRMFENAYDGFFIVSGVYLVIGIVLCVFRQRLLKMPANNAIIKQAIK